MDGRRNFRISVEGTADEQTKKEIAEDRALDLKNRAWDEFFDGELGVKEVEKTTYQKRLCSDAILATKLVLKDLKLKKFSDALPLEISNIHILEKTEFDRLKPNENTAAFQATGNIFVPLNQNKAHFISNITHELAHQIQYMEFKLNADEQDDGDIDITYDQPRSGMANSGLPLTSEYVFTGVMEAVTEKFAIATRHEFVQINRTLNKTERDQLLSDVAYHPQLLVVDTLIYRLSPTPEQANEIWRQLGRDHITGSYRTINWMETRERGVTKILAHMGTDPKSALEAAQKLKMPDVVEEITYFIKVHGLDDEEDQSL